ncbi:MAG: hypothetical protein IJK14_07785, partial [Clostridia bacterium]|nr:hypothetical protein [Clostridia bacterium]
MDPAALPIGEAIPCTPIPPVQSLPRPRPEHSVLKDGQAVRAFGKRGSDTGKDPGTQRLNRTAAIPGGIQASVPTKKESRQRLLKILEQPGIRTVFQHVYFPGIGREIELPFFQ